MYSTNILPESEVRRSLPLINPEPEVAVVFIYSYVYVCMLCYSLRMYAWRYSIAM